MAVANARVGGGSAGAASDVEGARDVAKTVAAFAGRQQGAHFTSETPEDTFEDMDTLANDVLSGVVVAYP